MHTVNFNKLAVSSLQESYSLSVLMYSIPAMSLSAKQIRELGICWNSVIDKLFKYIKWESVNGVLHGLGRLNISHLIMLQKVTFNKHLFLSANSMLYNVFNWWWYVTNSFHATISRLGVDFVCKPPVWRLCRLEYICLFHLFS